MATYLYRLGRSAFRRRRLVATLWVVLLAAVATGALTLSGPTVNSFSIPGTQSQQAIDLLEERFPAATADRATARVVFAAPDGATLADPAHKAAVEQALAELRQRPKVVAVTDPFQTGAVNPTGTIGYAQATYAVQAAELTEADREGLVATVEHARAGGLTVEVGGDVLQATPETGIAEVIGVAVAALVLVITFGSLVAAGLPLLTALLGIGIGVGAIFAATGFMNLSSTTSILALMIGLAVAIDYSLFIVSRYRHELAIGRDPEEAAGRAVGTAGSAVVFAGLTVVIALAALSVIGIPFLTEMGVAAALTVAVAVVIALTLLPALLGFAGRRILGGRVPGLRARDPEADSATPSFGHRWAQAVTRRPVAVLLLAVVALGVIAVPGLDLRLGMPDDSTAAPDTTQRKAYDLLAAGFGPGFNGPLTVVVETGAGQAQTGAEQVAQSIRGLTNVAAVTPPVTNPTGDTALLTVIPTTGPSTAETEELVRAIRDRDGAVAGTTVSVTGLTALNIDVSEKLAASLLPYLAVVVGLAFILLTLVFRSLLVPLKATVGFLLSVAATFGAVVAVFQWGWLAEVFGVEQTAPVISFLPIFLVGVVFGLAMDYQVFLVTRMREEYVHGAEPRTAIVAGFSHGARVVTAAAIIMISVFAGFVLSPDSIIKSIGFALGVAVLFDALIVRMTIVPAVMALLGRTAWWLPRWLDRVLPDVDVEGDRLQRLLDESSTADAPEPATAGRVG